MMPLFVSEIIGVIALIVAAGTIAISIVKDK